MRESTRKIARTRVQITSKSSEHKWYAIGGVYEVYSYPRDRTKYKVPNTSLLIDKTDCKRIARVHPEITLQELTDLQSNEEIANLRKQIIDLTAERDIAGKATVEIAFKLANAEKELSESLSNFHYLQNRSIALVNELTQHIEERERGNEAWQEKVDSLELELGTKHIYNWYLKPIFMFCAGATTAIVAVTWWIRWYL